MSDLSSAHRDSWQGEFLSGRSLVLKVIFKYAGARRQTHTHTHSDLDRHINRPTDMTINTHTHTQILGNMQDVKTTLPTLQQRSGLVFASPGREDASLGKFVHSICSPRLLSLLCYFVFPPLPFSLPSLFFVVQSPS